MTDRAKKREDWIDLSRGFAMVLVVFGHALIGVTNSAETTQLSRFLILLIYCIHMPVLFALAGLMSHSLISRPTDQFLKQTLTRVVWPYMLWSCVLLLMHFLMSGHTNSVVATFEPWSILWRPPAVMWFLYVLFCAILLRRLVYQHRLLSITLGVLCLCAPYIVESRFEHIRFVGLFLLASEVSPKGLELFRERRVWFSAVGVMSVLVWIAWQKSSAAFTGYPGASWQFLSAMIASPICVFVGAICVTERSKTNAILQLLSNFGRYSMAIFVLHIFFTAGTRIVLAQFGFTDVWGVTIMATLTGLLIPLLIAQMVATWRIRPFLGWQRA